MIDWDVFSPNCMESHEADWERSPAQPSLRSRKPGNNRMRMAKERNQAIDDSLTCNELFCLVKWEVKEAEEICNVIPE